MQGGTAEDSQTLEDAIKSLVSHAAAIRPEEMTQETELIEHLDLNCDDAALLMRDFAREFGVDMAGYRFADHFGRGGFQGHRAFALWMMTSLAPAIRRRLAMARADECAVTIGHMVASAKAGRWLSLAEAGPDRLRRGAIAQTNPMRRREVFLGFLLFLGAALFFAVGTAMIWGVLNSWDAFEGPVRYLIAGILSAAILPVFLWVSIDDARAYLRAKLKPRPKAP